MHIYIHTQVCSCTYLFPSHSSTGSWQFSLNLLLCIHTHAQTHTRMYIKTHVLTFRFFFSFCFAYVLLPHSHSHTRTRSRQQAITKTTVTTTTTAIKTIITLLLLRCGTTWVNERIHTYIQKDRHSNTHTHALWQNTMREGEALYTRALTLYAAPICPGKERAKKKERARAFKHPEDSLSFSSCRRPKIYKQISLNTNN